MQFPLVSAVSFVEFYLVLEIEDIVFSVFRIKWNVMSCREMKYFLSRLERL